MSLKKLLELRSQLDAARLAAAEHRNTRPGFAERRSALERRRDALSLRIDELPDDTSEQDRNAIEAELAELESDAAALAQEEAAFDAAGFDTEQARLDGAAANLEHQIADIESRNHGPEPALRSQVITINEEENMHKYASAQLRTSEARTAFFEREESKNFIENFRAIGKSGRAVDNVGAIIPDIWLDVLREETVAESKLLKYCRYGKVSGTARQPMTDAMPVAIWFEALGKLNETSMGFADVEYEAYGLGSYIAVPDLYLASGTIVDLGTDIMNALISALAAGKDKGILYGNNTKMPLGVVPRLAQTSDPSDQSINYTWHDYHSTNIITVSSSDTGAAFFRSLALAKKVVKRHNRPTPHGLVWCMNPTTAAHVDAEATYANVLALGAKDNPENWMPVLGGHREIIDDIPDNNIIVGYFDLYGFAERDGGKVASSDIPMFLNNKTVFKAVTWADGMPLVPDAFAVIGINSTSPTTSLSFDPDYANTDMNDLTVTAAAHGSSSGKTVLTVSGKLADADTLKYKVGIEQPGIGTALDKTWTALTSGSTGITAAAGTWITVAELDAKGNVVGVGYVISVPKA